MISQEIIFNEPLKSEIDYYLSKENIDEFKNHEKALIIAQLDTDEKGTKYYISDRIEYYIKKRHNFFQTYNGVYVFMIFKNYNLSELSQEFYDDLAKKHFPEAVKHLEENGMYPITSSYHPREIYLTIKDGVVTNIEEYSR
jgi:predicted metal-dependent hydrolase